ncbi:hypothetical protein ACXR0O_25435 [Verrucomicrobiota bacterium sgz303538]
MSPFYLPLGFAAASVTITAAFLAYGSRESVALLAFRRAWTLWFVLVFFGGLGASAAGYQHMLSLHRSGDEACAFLLISAFLGIILPAYSGFGLFAWAAPLAWRRIIERREQLRAQKQQRIGNAP